MPLVSSYTPQKTSENLWSFQESIERDHHSGIKWFIRWKKEYDLKLVSFKDFLKGLYLRIFTEDLPKLGLLCGIGYWMKCLNLFRKWLFKEDHKDVRPTWLRKKSNQDNYLVEQRQN